MVKQRVVGLLLIGELVQIELMCLIGRGRGGRRERRYGRNG